MDEEEDIYTVVQPDIVIICDPKKIDENKYQFQIDVPGFNKDNLKVEVSDNLLTINGETESRKYHKQYSLSRHVTDIEASILDGVLTIDLYLKEIVKPKQIELK